MESHRRRENAKPTNAENPRDSLNELELEYIDIQSKLSEYNKIGSKENIKKITEKITSCIQYIQILNKRVDKSQIEKIQRIENQFKEILSKFDESNIGNNAVPQSPRLFRKIYSNILNNDQDGTQQNKPQLSEVEEKLRAMRQKRLTRLSTFVNEQSKLSEARSSGNNEEICEIETAIKSIEKSCPEKVINFKSIEEENNTNSGNDGGESGVNEDISKQTRSETKINQNSFKKYNFTLNSMETEKPKLITKPSSTKKFIQKFNCALNQNIGSSNEDLTKETSHECSDDQFKNKVSAAKDISTDIKDVDRDKARKLTEDKIISRTFSKPGTETDINRTFHSPNHILNTFGETSSNGNVKIEAINNKTREPHVILKYTSDIGKTKLNKNNSEVNKITHLKDNEKVELSLHLKNSTNETDEIKLKNIEFPKYKITSNDECLEKLEFPARSITFIAKKQKNHGDKVLKKLQFTWNSLSKIEENDSDIDSDEIEDMKKSLNDTYSLLEEFERKLDKLEEKLALNKTTNENCRKMEDIRKRLEETTQEITKFKGLKRDLCYIHLLNKLSNFYSEIIKISSSKTDTSKEKKILLVDIEKEIKTLEKKVINNELLLHEVIDEQVESIAKKFLKK